MSKKVIVIGGNNGLYNLGDDAMYEVATSVIQDAGADIVIDAWSNFSSPYKQLPHIFKPFPFLIPRIINVFIDLFRYFLTELQQIRPLSWLGNLDPLIRIYNREIKDSDLVVFPGTGSMNDLFPAIGVFGRGMVINIAKKYNKPVFISGNGIGPLTGLNAWISRRYINYVKKIFVRDQTASKRELLNLGVEENKITEYMDDAFFLTPKPQDYDSAKNILGKIGVKDNFIVINVHAWSSKIKDKFLPVIKQIVEGYNQSQFLFLPNNFSGKYDDRNILNSIYEQLNKPKNVFLLTERITASQSKAILSFSKLSIATRYHTGVFSLSVGKPTILIYTDHDYYDSKMKGILRWYGLEEYAIGLSEIAEVPNKLSFIENGYDNIIRKIDETNKTLRSQGYAAGREIISLLNNG